MKTEEKDGNSKEDESVDDSNKLKIQTGRAMIKDDIREDVRCFSEWQKPINEWLGPLSSWQEPLASWQQPLMEW